mgnify:FL=1
MHAEDAEFFEECKQVMPIDEIVIKAETLCCVLDEDYYIPGLPVLIPQDEGLNQTRDDTEDPALFQRLNDISPDRYFDGREKEPEAEGKEKEKEKEKELEEEGWQT